MKVRQERGNVTFELAAVSVFLVALTIVCVYAGLMVFGATLNDKACRDACRAAAQGKTAAEAEGIARAILATHGGGNGFITAPTLQSITYQDFNGTPPVDESPFVTVVTTSDANLPFASPEFFGERLATNTVTFTQRYTFPIIKVR